MDNPEKMATYGTQDDYYSYRWHTSLTGVSVICNYVLRLVLAFCSYHLYSVYIKMFLILENFMEPSIICVHNSSYLCSENFNDALGVMWSRKSKKDR